MATNRRTDSDIDYTPEGANPPYDKDDPTNRGYDEAAHSGNEDVAIALLEKGADPDAGEAGYTALHAAVLRSGVRLVNALVMHGADQNRRMTKGTPVRRNSEDF